MVVSGSSNYNMLLKVKRTLYIISRNQHNPSFDESVNYSSPENIPEVVEGSCQGSRLWECIQIGLQVLCSEPSALPSDPGAAAGEQGLQSLQEKTLGESVWLAPFHPDNIFRRHPCHCNMSQKGHFSGDMDSDDLQSLTGTYCRLYNSTWCPSLPENPRHRHMGPWCHLTSN